MSTIEQLQARLSRYSKILEICYTSHERKTVLEAMQVIGFDLQTELDAYERGVYP